MHEYPITKRIIALCMEHAEAQGGAHVRTINLVIGESCGYLADAILLYFDIIAEKTLCEGACVRVEHIKPKLRCKKCGVFFERKPFRFDCEDTACGGEGEPTDIGREFYIKSIEIE
jgi:hydrogenase nickel incorporation protein HypA/HybF